MADGGVRWHTGRTLSGISANSLFATSSQTDGAATTIRRQRDRCVPSTWPSVRSEYRGGLRQPRVYQKGGARGSLCGSVVNSRWSQAGCERPNNGSLTALPLHAYPALLEVDGLQLPIQDVIRPLCFHCAGRSHTQVVGVVDGHGGSLLHTQYARLRRRASAPKGAVGARRDD